MSFIYIGTVESKYAWLAVMWEGMWEAYMKTTKVRMVGATGYFRSFKIALYNKAATKHR